MNILHLMDIQGHVIELVGTYFVVSIRLNEKPKDIYKTLKSTHTHSVTNQDINHNPFLESFIKDAIAVKHGFILVAIGILLLALRDILSYFSVGHNINVDGLGPLLLVGVITVSSFFLTKYNIKKQRNNARKDLARFP